MEEEGWRKGAGEREVEEGEEQGQKSEMGEGRGGVEEDHYAVTCI